MIQRESNAKALLVLKVEELSQKIFDKWSSPQTATRIKTSNSRKQPFRKAFGSLPTGLEICDASCGYGIDALCMASWGQKVMAFERSEILAEALSLAQRRHLSAGSLLAQTLENITFMTQDSKASSVDWGRFSRIYFDPIYPDRKGSALGKLDLRQLRELVGDDHDAAETLELLLKTPVERVIVKRGLKAADLRPGTKPDLSCLGSSTRYDVYLKKT